MSLEQDSITPLAIVSEMKPEEKDPRDEILEPIIFTKKRC